MLDTLIVVLPIFLIIGAGLASAMTGLLEDSVADGLSDFVFIVAIPVLLFRTLATAPLPEVQPWFYWLAYFIGLAIVWIITTLIVTRIFGLKGAEVPIAGLTAVQSNTVFVGIPLVLLAVGEQAAVPMFLLIAVHLPLTMTVATLLVERGDQNGDKWGAMLRKLALHPILLGIIVGALWRIAGFGLPGSVNSAMKLLGDAAGPTALFALGMTLKRYGLGAPLVQVGVLSALKLLVQPALVYILAFHVFPMPPVWAAVAVIFAACPSGVNAYLLAQRYKTGVALSSSLVAASTLFAVVTMTGWVWLVSGIK
jgi:malonate transporter and related proteins